MARTLLLICGSLHGKCLSCTCRAVHNNVTILPLEKRLAKLLATLVKNIILCCLVVKNLFKIVVSLTIIKVIIGLHSYLIFIWINFHYLSLALFCFEKRANSS